MIELQEELVLKEKELEREHGAKDVMKLPNPTLKDKPIPNTIYTSMNFDTARSSSINSRWVVMEENGKGLCSRLFIYMKRVVAGEKCRHTTIGKLFIQSM